MTAGTQESDPFAREMGKKVSVPPPVVGAAAGATGGTAAGKKKKRISVDMVGNPKGFQCVAQSPSSSVSPRLLSLYLPEMNVVLSADSPSVPQTHRSRFGR